MINLIGCIAFVIYGVFSGMLLVYHYSNAILCVIQIYHLIKHEKVLHNENLVNVFNNLYTDQRVEKFAKPCENVYQIEVIGNNWGGTPEMSRTLSIFKNFFTFQKLRFAYLEFQWKLFFELLKKADRNTILHANDLDALLPNYLVSKNQKNSFSLGQSRDFYRNANCYQSLGSACLRF